MDLSTLLQYPKPQTIRLLDVAVIGPLMVWAGVKLRDEHPNAGFALIFFGGTTMTYNLQNYLIAREEGEL